MGHQIVEPGIFLNGLRSILGYLDEAVYVLVANIYKVFFYVSTSTIIGGDVIKAFFQRIQLIIGIFMIFKLAIALLNLIINPDMMKDKNAGTGKIVMRVILCLLMLTLILPLNIPNAANKTEQGYTSYNGFINDNGILFGTLYALQDRVLRENILAKIILGYAGTTQKSNEVPTAEIEDLSNAGNMLATSVLKSFILVNVKDDTAEDICKGDEEKCENVYCLEEVQKSGYTEEDASVGQITGVVSKKCDSDGLEYYAFAYYPVISTIVGAVLALILIGYTIDVSVRALKLAALRLVAPIPIISYVDPKASKDGAFASWTKTLTSTYIDLFLRLSIIYFAIFVIATIQQDGLYIAPGATGLVRVFSYVFIVVGILFFVKQAPQFIKTMLGAKGVGFGPGVSGALGFLGGMVAGGGLAGAANAALTAANATNEAQAQGKQGPGAWSTGRDLVTKMRLGDDKATGGMLNNAQRALTRTAKRQIGERRLQQLGINYDAADRAKVAMFQAQDLASDFSAIRSRMASTPGGIGGLSSSDQQMIASFKASHAGDHAVMAHDAGVLDDTGFMDYVVNTTQTEYQKQKKTYDDADSLMKKYGVTTTPEEKYRANTYRKAAGRMIDNAIPRTRRAEERRDHTNAQGGGTWNENYRNQGTGRGDHVDKARMKDIFKDGH